MEQLGAPSGHIDSSRDDFSSDLDEPVRETIMRDVRAVGQKLYYVLLPQSRHDKGSGLRDWDLWGPLVLCLSLGIILAFQANNSENAGNEFALVFMLMWVGSGVVTLNCLLLKGKISIFQSICVLGYCVFPLVIAAALSAAIRIRALKFIFVLAGFLWSTGASVGFMTDIVPDDRKALGVYPVWLFYAAISWMILLT
eukprot:GEMP01020244.1.p1 GENE.GEMP01020244.1~~GEMP01020244.1.p1  ORF type:complete len:197 (+),score=23.16 GEMP01020244.1:327-917(+)